MCSSSRRRTTTAWSRWCLDVPAPRVASTLMNAATDGAEHDGTLLRLAAGGFRDMTRVLAAGHPGIWPGYLRRERRGPSSPRSMRLVTDLGVMRDRVAARDRPGLPSPRSRRRARPRRSPSGPPPCGPNTLPSCVSRSLDRAGVLWPRSRRWRLNAGIGIYDIEIAHSAEGPREVLDPRGRLRRTPTSSPAGRVVIAATTARTERLS